jgi:hypothetical protein
MDYHNCKRIHEQCVQFLLSCVWFAIFEILHLCLIDIFRITTSYGFLPYCNACITTQSYHMHCGQHYDTCMWVTKFVMIWLTL